MGLRVRLQSRLRYPRRGRRSWHWLVPRHRRVFLSLSVQYLRGFIPPSPFRNVLRAALTTWHLNGEHRHDVERGVPMETLQVVR